MMSQPRRLILRNAQSLGDAVMLTGALRDLHAAYPGEFSTDVRSACPDVWLHNPYLTRIPDGTSDAVVLDCRYPLIERSNELPYHFLHGFIHWLNGVLGLAIEPTAFHGDIHLSAEEIAAPSITERLSGRQMPYWLIVAGGKHDYTVKWWSPRRFQEVVDRFRSRILFVQVGGGGDAHPPLKGVIDLRGKTSVRELILLTHHAQGVLCPVTGLMHLSAAVPLPATAIATRACVVVAGGREPPQWEAYPLHQFIHTVGAIPCCAFGGCWRSRVMPLNDGSEHDDPANLCVRPGADGLPECMDMIDSEEVTRRISTYFAGGALRYVSSDEAAKVAAAVTAEADRL